MPDYREEEIEEWYNQYHQTIFKFILMMIKDYQQAEDLTHDTFYKAYKHFHSFNHNSSPKTWLFSIAHNLTVDFLRKRKPLRIFKEIFTQNRESNSNYLPEQYVQMKESSMELYDAISQLKESYRKVIILRKIKGFSIIEVSEILSWSESKVKSTLHRAIQLLEKNLTKEDYFNEQIKRG